jgi:hypothetical protein
VSNLILPRRGFLIGLASLLAAPAVVKAEVLMPVRVWRWRPRVVRTRVFGQDFYTCSVEKLIGCEDWALVELPPNATRPLPGTKPDGHRIDGKHYLIPFDYAAIREARVPLPKTGDQA